MIAMRWKFTLVTANSVASVLLIWLHWRKGAKTRKAIETGDGNVKFTRDPLAYVIFPAAALLPAWAAFNDYQRHSSGNLWGLAVLTMLLFAATAELFRLPGTVIIVHDGIEQHFWLQGEKRIRWGEIKEIKEGVFGGSLTITGTDGTKIVYSDQLADRPRFLAEIEKHCRGNLPPEFLSRVAASSQASQKTG